MYLDANELSKYLHIKRSTLYAWAAQGKVPSKKIHGLVRFRRDDIEQWLNSFPARPAVRRPQRARTSKAAEIDRLIASAKRNVYTARRGETRPKSSPIGKEGADGAV